MVQRQVGRMLKPEINEPQLFLDDRKLAEIYRVHRVWHQARKHPEAVLKAEHAWESHCPVAYGTVLWREGKFHFWYNAWTRHIKPRVCYATSTDGMHWEKPALRRFEVCGTWDNNVVIQHPKATGLIDDAAVLDDAVDAQYPLKALYWQGRYGTNPCGIQLAGSRDGIAWTHLGAPLAHWEDRFNAAASKIDGQWVVLGRAPGSWERIKQRRVYRTVSWDLRKWSAPELVLAPDAEDGPRMEYYSAQIFAHPGARPNGAGGVKRRSDGLVLGAIERMHMTPDKLDTEIVWSYDLGQTWERARARPRFIEWGAPQSFDDTWIALPTNGPIVRENRWWFFYSGRGAAHYAAYPHNHGGIGLATLRIDGFCSLQALESAGKVVTKPLVWPGGDLLVNLDMRRDLTSHPTNTLCGELRVEVQTREGKPVRGYTREDAPVMCANSVRAEGCYQTYRWNGDRSLGALRGKPVVLTFHVRDGHLYGFMGGKTG